MSKLKQVMARVLSIHAGSIDERTSPGTVESWDSFNQIMLISELETAFGVKFTMGEIQRMNSYKDIKKVLKEKGVPIGDQD